MLDWITRHPNKRFPEQVAMSVGTTVRGDSRTRPLYIERGKAIQVPLRIRFAQCTPGPVVLLDLPRRSNVIFGRGKGMCVAGKRESRGRC